ncbi:hypothetical protein HMPREF7215_2137 [Pyramidobacter piscolens W5455]|uniref:Uncharacterized protein n=1 Tax=Pyramidobacter piscolens W5455 TaxID=352165 RepID=A0ABM9ZU80_9BACT|nr:hypothetical protein HMPREF7215_2137 [Pyramidobacter piscolens W5455]
MPPFYAIIYLIYKFIFPEKYAINNSLFRIAKRHIVFDL